MRHLLSFKSLGGRERGSWQSRFCVDKAQPKQECKLTPFLAWKLFSNLWQRHGQSNYWQRGSQCLVSTKDQTEENNTSPWLKPSIVDGCKAQALLLNRGGWLVSALKSLYLFFSFQYTSLHRQVRKRLKGKYRYLLRVKYLFPPQRCKWAVRVSLGIKVFINPYRLAKGRHRYARIFCTLFWGEIYKGWRGQVGLVKALFQHIRTVGLRQNQYKTLMKRQGYRLNSFLAKVVFYGSTSDASGTTRRADSALIFRGYQWHQ